jgi:hypothetical protein
MKTRARGDFDVKLTPQGTDDKSEDATVGRMSISKQLHGDLEGTGKGQMLTASTDVKGSAIYIAIERITGALHGRSGSFLLQHSGLMTRGAPHLTISVVPDSGTGQLTGLAGQMAITIADGKHSYDFEYTLAPAPERLADRAQRWPRSGGARALALRYVHVGSSIVIARRVGRRSGTLAAASARLPPRGRRPTCRIQSSAHCFADGHRAFAALFLPSIQVCLGAWLPTRSVRAGRGALHVRWPVLTGLAIAAVLAWALPRDLVLHGRGTEAFG